MLAILYSYRCGVFWTFSGVDSNDLCLRLSGQPPSRLDALGLGENGASGERSCRYSWRDWRVVFFGKRGETVKKHSRYRQPLGNTSFFCKCLGKMRRGRLLYQSLSILSQVDGQHGLAQLLARCRAGHGGWPWEICWSKVSEKSGDLNRGLS